MSITIASNLPYLTQFYQDLQTFREALFILQRQVDELDALKVHHYEEILEHEEEVWDAVQGKVRSALLEITYSIFIIRTH